MFIALVGLAAGLTLLYRNSIESLGFMSGSLRALVCHSPVAVTVVHCHGLLYAVLVLLPKRGCHSGIFVSDVSPEASLFTLLFSGVILSTNVLAFCLLNSLFKSILTTFVILQDLADGGTVVTSLKSVPLLSVFLSLTLHSVGFLFISLTLLRKSDDKFCTYGVDELDDGAILCSGSKRLDNDLHVSLGLLSVICLWLLFEYCFDSEE